MLEKQYRLKNIYYFGVFGKILNEIFSSPYSILGISNRILNGTQFPFQIF